MCCLCQDETGPVLSGTSGLFADLVSDEDSEAAGFCMATDGNGKFLRD